MSSTIENQRNGEAKNEGRRNRKRAAEVDEPATLPFTGNSPKSSQKRTRRQAVVRGFGQQRQVEFIGLLMNGASPQGACKKLKLPLVKFWMALEYDAEFAAELQKVWDSLSFNVLAALYQAAMKGNSMAQQFWLKHRPPPRWSQFPVGSILVDDLETLTDDELLKRARQEAPDFAAEIAARAAKAGSGLPPKTVPGTDLRPGQ
jgi:hypothetical protein